LEVGNRKSKIDISDRVWFVYTVQPRAPTEQLSFDSHVVVSARGGFKRPDKCQEATIYGNSPCGVARSTFSQ